MSGRGFADVLTEQGLSATQEFAFPDDVPAPTARLARRPYRPGGPELSIIGFGGVMLQSMEQPEADEIVAWAIEKGVNYFDVAPSYGKAQELLGPALEPYRDDCFLACKTGKRDAAGAREDLEESLRALRTDHFDLYQLHGLDGPDDVDAATGKGGALETFVAARDEGKVRHLGFSAHDEESALTIMDRFDFDSMLLPINCVCIENGNFGPAAIAQATERGMAILAIKALAWTSWADRPSRNFPTWYQPISDPDVARLALCYTLDQPVVAAVSTGAPDLLPMTVEAALRYRPLTDDERVRLMDRIEGVLPIMAT